MLTNTLREMISPARERFQASNYLLETRHRLEEALEDLSELQATFKPSEECWSAVEIMEHIAIIEGFVHRRFLVTVGSATDGSNDSPGLSDYLLVQKVLDRLQKGVAPEASLPTGKCTLASVLQTFRERRTQTVQLVEETSSLRERISSHPLFGPLDAYQWALAVSAHTARHTAQIAELKAHPQFPQKHSVAVG